MRKFFTLIAVSAMMGWSNYAQAYTKDQLNKELSTKIAGYVDGESFSLDFTLFLNSSDRASILKLADNLFITRQKNQFIGLSTVSGEDPNKWPDMSRDVDKKNNTWAISSGTEYKGWFSRTSSGEKTTQDFSSGAKLSISYDKESTTTTIALKVDNDWSDVVTISGLTLKATDIQILEDDPSGKYSSIVSSDELVQFLDLSLAGARFFKLMTHDGTLLAAPENATDGSQVEMNETGTVGCIEPTFDQDIHEQGAVRLVAYPSGLLLQEAILKNGDAELSNAVNFTLWKKKKDNDSHDMSTPVYIKHKDSRKWLGSDESKKIAMKEEAQAWYPVPQQTIDVTMHEVNGYYYASTYFPQSYVLPAGMAAYSLNYEPGEKTLTVSKKTSEGGTTPRHTPLLLAGETKGNDWVDLGNKKWKVTFQLSETDTGTPETVQFGTYNSISPSLANSRYGYKIDYAYTFNYDSNGNLGFYKTTNNIGGFKCYLPGALVHPEDDGTSATKMLQIKFVDMLTAITGVEASEPEAPKGIYGLDGRQYKTLQKGINIVNGKKIVIK